MYILHNNGTARRLENDIAWVMTPERLFGIRRRGCLNRGSGKILGSDFLLCFMKISDDFVMYKKYKQKCFYFLADVIKNCAARVYSKNLRDGRIVFCEKFSRNN